MRARWISGPGLAVMIACGPLFAQDQPEGLEPVEGPDIPPPVESGEVMDQDVRIIRTEKRTITEYLVNGRVRAAKIEPSAGPVYYLVDMDGDGQLDTRSTEFDPDVLVANWVLFSW